VPGCSWRHDSTVDHTVFIAKGSVASLEVLVRKHFEEDRRDGQEEQQHGLEAVRSEQHVGVMQRVGKLARRALRGVIDDFYLPVLRRKSVRQHLDGLLFVRKFPGNIALIKNHLELLRLSGRIQLSSICWASFAYLVSK